MLPRPAPALSVKSSTLNTRPVTVGGGGCRNDDDVAHADIAGDASCDSTFGSDDQANPESGPALIFAALGVRKLKFILGIGTARLHKCLTWLEENIFVVGRVQSAKDATAAKLAKLGQQLSFGAVVGDGNLLDLDSDLDLDQRNRTTAAPLVTLTEHRLPQPPPPTAVLRVVFPIMPAVPRPPPR